MAVILSWVFRLKLLIIVLIPFSCSSVYALKDHEVINLQPNEKYIRKENAEFTIFCHESVSKSILYVWRSAELLFENVPLSYEIFMGVNSSEVLHKKQTKSMLDPTSWFAGQKTKIAFPAFSEFCIGVTAKEKYVINFKVKTVDYWKVLQTIIGVVLLLSAPSLSRNPFFHYTSGMTLGVVLSVLLLTIFLTRFMPKKSFAYTLMFFGFSFVTYILQLVFQDINAIIANYTDYIIAYCLFTSVVSFMFCYRLGPVKNIRTFNMIQWSMQVIASLLIYLSSEYREVSTAFLLILIGAKNIPSKWTAKCWQLWYWYFPPRIQLLSESEYIEQGNIETRKALEDLRKFCRSPDCNIWRTIQNIKQPIRFAQFIDNGNHYTDEELLNYNSEEFDGYSEEDEDISSETSQLNNSARQSVSNGLQR